MSEPTAPVRVPRPRGDVRVMVCLPPEVGERLRRLAEEDCTPVSVLIRRWVVQQLRQLESERERLAS